MASGRVREGPLWFAWALLIFALGTVLWDVLARRRDAASATDRDAPSNATLAVVALVTGAVAFLLRLVWPVGREVWGLQLGYFASYVVLFIAGCAVTSRRWLESWPATQVRTWRRIAWIALPVLPLAALLGGPLLGLRGRPEGGWNVPALVYVLWEPLIAWGVILGLLRRFQRRFAEPGLLWQRLSRRAFAIYVIHPPVVVAVALAWRGVTAPALLKFAVSGGVSCVLCYLLAGALLRVSGVSRVL